MLATAADLSKAARGYEVRLTGQLRYVPAKQTFDRFDVVAVGSHWGDHTHVTSPARPGKSLLGFVFELVPDTPGNRIPPQGVRNADTYFGRD